ncbi:uncharacterized protein LOC124379999 isoform X1 [Silurus meridionalis]|uniref:uncharacterized protein LOC124379999 isoform X1 n=1 Tax=Silurus meridionalis TaxID=175797 RepID=UPI001EEA2C22|nr:uncharacterized protein LOC124379999 isoform X1 [Silurus meridionalis]XP_046696628.1 uncharacterized protein LOC124379999 isoform X1 [Silurus meridionalis]
MKTVLLFYLLVCCGADINFTEKLVDLGQNVTLQCEVAVRHVSWFLMKPSEPPVYVLRSYSSKILVPHYSNRTFSKIFSLQQNSSLFIHNISTNELGVYHCIHCGSPPNISRGIRLYTQNHAAGCLENLHTSGLKNQTSKPDHQQSEENGLTLLPFLIVSVIINCTLVITVTVFVGRCCRRPPKTREQPSDPGVQSGQNSAELVYSQVKFVSNKKRAKTKNLNSTYALLHLPNQ